MSNMWTVIKFTFLSNFRMKSFKVMTLILAILVTVGINLPTIIDKFSSNEPDRIGVFDTNQEYTQKLSEFYGSQENPRMTIVPLSDTGSQEGNDALGREMMSSGEIKGYIEFADEIVGGFPKVIYKSENAMDSSVMSELRLGLQNVKTDQILKDISKEQLAIIQAPISIDSVQMKTGDDTAGSGRTKQEMVTAFILVYAMLFMIYMSVISYGNSIAVSITQEKSSRVMELLITSSSPVKQMFGKIFGVCLLGLLQIGVIIVVALLNLLLPTNQGMIQELNLQITDLPIDLFIYFFIFYLGGFFLYAMIAAGIGSVVSRIEDVGQAIMPMLFLVMGGFFIAMFGLQTPNSTFITAMSFVPFFSPMIMFLRLGLSDPPMWEAIVSIIILFGSIIVLGWLAAKIYRTGVLLYGKRPSIKELRKAMKSM